MARRKGKQDPDDIPASEQDANEEERDYSVRAVERVCLILNLLQESVDGITLNEVAQTTGLPKSSAFRYLWTLENHRYVERDEAGGLFRLGLGFVGMQSRHLEILRERARPFLEQLRDDIGETANLGLLDGDHVIYLDIVESRRGVRLAASRGDRDPIHCTALGKAIAAQLPEDRVRELLDETGLARRTDNTITSIDEYLEELGKVRRVGYAIDDRENEDDGRCVAVPLLGTRLPAAISISGPSSRFSAQEARKAAKVLIDIAAGIATNPVAVG
ncbi:MULTISPECIES: IclR family transcriptional regulator [Amycolatopsis]|uniref:IclR family transcriptional regulator, acetate operon repressor n=2 Tax=Amycolatopsis TaxID=1813 RepID=A0A1I3UYB1_9PSEU|nr:IclR family transcriptional regulator [Amycolatopsis sacchari]SFJ88374.1 IclR family transcriptional regulator, acetate operon repressor [Amycolatopsis sacchari]